MPKIDYFQKELKNNTDPSFIMFIKYLSNNSDSQSVIFCDSYIIDPIKDIPIFHSYYMNHSFHNHWILTDYDQIKYIEYFHHKNYIIVYNPDIQNIESYQDKYKFISMDQNILEYIKDNII